MYSLGRVQTTFIYRFICVMPKAYEHTLQKQQTHIQSPLLGPGAQGSPYVGPWGLWMYVCVISYCIF